MMKTKDPIERLRCYLPFEIEADGGFTRTEYPQPNSLTIAELEGIVADLEAFYIKLPVDAEGIPIRLGDEIEYDYVNGRKIVKSVGKYDVYAYGDCEGGFFLTAACHHVKPDTVEGIIEDIWLDDDWHYLDDDASKQRITYYAERIRKAVCSTEVALVNTEGWLWVDEAEYNDLVDAKDERDRLRADVMKLGEQLDRLRGRDDA